MRMFITIRITLCQLQSMVRRYGRILVLPTASVICLALSLETDDKEGATRQSEEVWAKKDPVVSGVPIFIAHPKMSLVDFVGGVCLT